MDSIQANAENSEHSKIVFVIIEHYKYCN